jgi:hypothetical protein
MSDRYPSQLAEKIVVRCPDGLRDQIAALARANGRSANAEAVMALEAWVRNSSVSGMPAAMLDRLSLAFAQALESDPELGPIIQRAKSANTDEDQR